MAHIPPDALRLAGFGVFRYAFDGTVLYMDRTVFELLELEGTYPNPEAVVGLNVAELVQHIMPLGTIRNRMRAERVVRDLAYPFRTLRGTPKWAAHSSYLVRDPATGQEVIQAIVQDITERKRIEETLQRSEERFRRLVENAGDIIYQMDADARFVYANPVAIRTLGYSLDEILGRHYSEFVHPAMREEARYFVRSEYAAGRRRVYHEFPVIAKDCATVWLGQNLEILEENGAICGYQAVCRDITRQKAAEAALRSSEEKYRELVENANSIILRRDPSGVITFFNEYAQRFFGYSESEILGKNIVGTIMAETDSNGRDLAAMARDIGLNPEQYASNENENVRRDGERVWVAWTNKAIRDASGKIVEILCIGNDVTAIKRADQERRTIEAHMRQAQKLESLGTLAGGLAHDFNNLLVGVLGYAEMALLELPPHLPARECLLQIERSAKRAAELTHQLLAYAGRGRLSMASIDLGKLVEEMIPLIAVSIPKTITVTYDVHASIPVIQGDATQLRQLVLNLVINAADAIEDDAGNIRIQTGVRECDAAFLLRAHSDTTLEAGRYVFLRVTDSGHGMDAETLERIFDPFFTTRFIGRGLGLAAALGIVRGHHGGICVESRLGEGAAFEAIFPILHAEGTDASIDGEGLEGWKARGTVLVVDDEAPVREVVQAFLERAGLRVLLACDGREGLEVFKLHAEEIDVVVLDISMPHMDGDVLFGLIREIRPGIPVVFSSGYSERFDAALRDSGGYVSFIQKPYRANVLLSEVRHALEQGLRTRDYGLGTRD